LCTPLSLACGRLSGGVAHLMNDKSPSRGVGNGLIALGSVCVVAAIVGGGVHALGTDLPIVGSLLRQLLLGLFGLVLILFGLALIGIPHLDWVVVQKSLSCH
jgi:hypothetical protein